MASASFCLRTIQRPQLQLEYFENNTQVDTVLELTLWSMRWRDRKFDRTLRDYIGAEDIIQNMVPGAVDFWIWRLARASAGRR